MQLQMKTLIHILRIDPESLNHVVRFLCQNDRAVSIKSDHFEPTFTRPDFVHGRKLVPKTNHKPRLNRLQFIPTHLSSGSAWTSKRIGLALRIIRNNGPHVPVQTWRIKILPPNLNLLPCLESRNKLLV